MLRRGCLLFMLFGLCLGGLSCAPLEQPSGQSLTIAPATAESQIPLDYGQLVAVTPTTQAGGAALWFEKPDQITVVWVNRLQGRLGQSVLIIPRR